MIQNFIKRLYKLNTAQIITLGFAGVIFVGGLILLLPFCTAAGETTSFTDAMFTAATCVCVTGLVTVTTAVHWSTVGKIVILILIQIGGIGLISLASIIFIQLHRKISMRNRRLIKEAYNLDQMYGLVKVVKKVIACVFGAEFCGAVFYSFRFIPQFGLVRGIARSIFTAVSAFCNAGIDILGENSLAPYVDDPLVNITTIIIIIISGLGFTVWWDLADKLKKAFTRQMPAKRIFKTLRLQSKIVITTSLILVLGGTFLIFLFEFNNPATMKDMSLGTKIMASAFQAVTTRTAGFLTIDQAAFSHATSALCLVLMLIGGSPMGTAGGIKTTTVAVLVLSIVANLRGKRDVETHNRKIRSSYVRSAVVVTGMSVAILFVMLILLCAAMPEADFLDVLYEITSAVGTVGLTRGLTPNLNTIGKWLVIVTMYLGRIGPLTLGTAVVVRAQKRSDKAYLAKEDIMIG
jgi:trk system potassium uptake protein TrkH